VRIEEISGLASYRHGVSNGKDEGRDAEHTFLFLEVDAAGPSVVLEDGGTGIAPIAPKSAVGSSTTA